MNLHQFSTVAMYQAWLGFPRSARINTPKYHSIQRRSNLMSRVQELESTARYILKENELYMWLWNCDIFQLDCNSHTVYFKSKINQIPFNSFWKKHWGMLAPSSQAFAMRASTCFALLSETVSDKCRRTYLKRWRRIKQLQTKRNAGKRQTVPCSLLSMPLSSIGDRAYSTIGSCTTNTANATLHEGNVELLNQNISQCSIR